MRTFGLIVAFAGVISTLGCSEERSDAWPEARLTELEPSYPAGFHRRVFIDAGHGARGNAGNRSAFCVAEQDFTLSLARELARALELTGHFETLVSREPGALVPYDARVERARSWDADAFVSLHSDMRGRLSQWSPAPGKTCPRSRAAPGYSVLFSDDGPPALVLGRQKLARALGHSLGRAGFLPYDGREYGRSYAADEQRGVFVDRHGAEERIFVLYQPRVPSVIVETHNAVDDREAARWQEASTRRAFAASVGAALVRALAPEADASVASRDERSRSRDATAHFRVPPERPKARLHIEQEARVAAKPP